jgi:hypothetical protein
MTVAAQARTRWLLVVVFAVGMAWVEAASVYYLRVMVDRVHPYQPSPLPMQGVLAPVELTREAATLVMLFIVGALAGATWRARTAYSLIAFGVWDIFYYVFLKLISGWPRSLLDWDVLFLLPLPWWGPVIAPVCIALLMVLWGTLVTQPASEKAAGSLTLNVWVWNGVGVALALYVFMADSLRVLPYGLDATRLVLPQSFNWPLFLVALTLMAAPVVQIAWRMRAAQIATPRRLR